MQEKKIALVLAAPFPNISVQIYANYCDYYRGKGLEQVSPPSLVLGHLNIKAEQLKVMKLQPIRSSFDS